VAEPRGEQKTKCWFRSVRSNTLCFYSFKRTTSANINTENKKLALPFNKFGFECIGVKKD
jgi:hypothetical protein